MGDENKLLLPFRNKPIVQHVLDQVMVSTCTEVIVVTSELTDVQIVHPHKVINPDYKEGMTTSIQAGVKAAAPTADGYLICLGDQPLIPTSTYDQIVKYLDHPGGIVVPFYGKKKGNPVLFGRDYRQAILDCQEAEGCRSVVEAHEQNIIKVEIDTPAILQDVDTPKDYGTLRQQGY